MFSSARDILFLVLAACAAALTIFTVWFLLELIRISRGIASTINSIEEKFRRVDDLISLVRDKVHDSTTAIIGLTSVVANIVRFFTNQRAKTRNGKKPKSTDDEF